MIVRFHTIYCVFTELLTSVWQKEVIRIAFEYVEATREAEKTTSDASTV